MEIIYLGHSAFLLKSKSVKVVCDPFGEAGLGFKMSKTEADVVTISHNYHDDHSNTEQVTGEYRIVDGPGEYEIKGVAITGVATFHDEEEGKKIGKNTVYSIDVDGVRIAHLGDLGHVLSKSQLSKLNGVDVLLANVGGESANGPKKTVEVIKQIAPSIVIPMHYKTKEHSDKWAHKAKLSEFLQEINMEPRKESKLKVSKSDLPEEMELVVLERKA